jgi:hypothetical protein
MLAVLCGGCGRSDIFNYVPDRCDSRHSGQIECMVLEDPLEAQRFLCNSNNPKSSNL